MEIILEAKASEELQKEILSELELPDPESDENESGNAGDNPENSQ